MTDDAHADAGYDTKRPSERPPSDRPSRGRERGQERTRTEDAEEPTTMADVSHTNPHTGESFGDTVAYERGPTVVVDGGKAGAVPDRDAESDEDDAENRGDETGETMGDVAHTPPHDAPDPNAVHMRGGEGAADEDEE